MKRKVWFWGVLALGLLLVAAGLWRDETLTLWRKAVAICLECIGLG